MKKLLLTLGTAAATVGPLATVVACGTSKDTTYAMETHVVTGGYSGQLGAIAAGTHTFGGAWADARTLVDTNADKLVAVGVEKYRIANDGIQARSDMSAYDMAVIQELFVRLIEESKTNSDLQVDLGDGEESLFELYSHSAYTKITEADQEVAYINNDTPETTKMLQTAPSLDGAEGTIFEAFDTTGTGFANFQVKDGQTIDINFIPSNNPADAELASSKLTAFLNSSIGSGTDFTVTVSTDYNAASLALNNGTIDLAFLPVNTWATHSKDTNFILQAGRPLQVATLGYDGTDITLPGATIENQGISALAMNEFSQLYVEDIKTGVDATGNTNLEAFNDVIADTSHVLNDFAVAARAAADDITDASQFIAGSYESFIFGNIDNEITQDILEVYVDGDENSWTMDGETVLADSTYAATSNTSGASFVFPQLWFNRHFSTVFKA